MKRYCQTLELVGDSQMIESFDFVVDNARLATLPRQAEWEPSRCTVVSCVLILTHDQRKPLKASPLIAAVRPDVIMRRRSRLY